MGQWGVSVGVSEIAVLTLLQIPLNHATHTNRLDGRRVPHDAPCGIDRGWNVQYHFAGNGALLAALVGLAASVFGSDCERQLVYQSRVRTLMVEYRRACATDKAKPDEIGRLPGGAETRSPQRDAQMGPRSLG